VEQIRVTAEMIIRPEPLSREAFLPFGDVLDTEGLSPELINFGNTQKFSSLAEIVVGESGRGQISIYRSRAIDLPFSIEVMERHPLGSQAFYPLHNRPFPVVVAAAGELPTAANLRVFLSNGSQGINIHAGVWHHYQLSLESSSDYLVIDRSGPGNNCDQHPLSPAALLNI
jgi:ureidoglycolate lyase